LHNTKYMRESPNTPSDIPERDTYNYYLHIIDSQLTPRLADGVADLVDKPTEARYKFIDRVREELIQNYAFAISHLILDDEIEMDSFQKTLAIQTLREGESQRRVQLFNTIVGKKLLKQREYPEINDSHEEVLDQCLTNNLEIDGSTINVSSSIDAQAWMEFEAEKFVDELDTDLNQLIVYLDENHPYSKRQRLQTKAIEKGKQVATIAGSVALGVFVSRTLDRRKTL
jgi:hypothetical protein